MRGLRAAEQPRPEFAETFGIALVEKMLAGGGPVITTETGGIGEAVGDTALVVPCSSPAAIAAALDHALTMPEADRARWSSGHEATPFNSIGSRCSRDCSPECPFRKGGA